MAVTIYNYATTGFHSVDMTKYGFKITESGKCLRIFARGESIEVLAAGDRVNLSITLGLTSAELTINGQIYTGKGNTITLDDIVLTEPIKLAATINGNGSFDVKKLEKYGTPAITDEQFSNMHLYFPFSPTGETLEAATADFTVYTTNAANWAKGTVIDIHDSAGILGRFYIDSCTKTYAGQYAITASDIIAQLVNDTFYGYIGYETVSQNTSNAYVYNKDFYSVEQLCQDIFGNREYTLSDTCKTLEVSGYIPFGNARDALQYLCIACGLYVRTYRTETPIIQSADTYATHTILENKVADNVSVSEIEAKTAVTIKMSRYYATTYDSTGSDNIFNGKLPVGEDTLLTEGYQTYTTGNTSPKPYILAARHKLRTYERFGTIVKTTGVSTIVHTTVDTGYNNSGDGSTYDEETGDSLMSLTGRPIEIGYCDIPLRNYYPAVYKFNPKPFYKTFGNGVALQFSDNATTVTVHNAETVANRMIAYHGKSREANITYVMSANEMPGDKLILPLDKTYGNISGRIISLDITPGVTKNFADAVIICDEEDENA